MSRFLVNPKYQQIFEESCPYIFAAFLLYMAAHGFGLINAGFNVDDWNTLGHTSMWAALGRWGMSAYYKYILLANFTDSFQIVTAFAIFGAISYLISRQIAGRKAYVAFIAIFSLGLSHPYWVDALNFNAHVTSNPLAILISLLAFQSALMPLGRAAYNALLAVCGGMLLCASLSLYQPFGSVGLIVPCISILSVQSINKKHLFKILTMSIMVLLLGAMFYLLLYNLYFALRPTAVENIRAGYVNLSEFSGKLHAFPKKFIVSVGAYPFNSTVYTVLQCALLAIAAFLCGADIIEFLRKRRYFDSIRLAVGFVGALAVPFLGWFIITADYPHRALASISFVLAAVLFSLRLNVFPPIFVKVDERQRSAVSLLLVLAALSVLAGSIVCSKAWFEQHIVYERDKALATSIVSAYALSAKPGDRLVLVGARQYSDIQSHHSVGRSAFDAFWSRMVIIKRVIGERHLNVSIVNATEFRHKCSEFPNAGSIVKTDGAVNVCLSAVVE